MVSNSVEPVKEKNFVAFGSWWRVELDADRTLYKISETFASVGFGVDISKLHAWYCIPHFKCLTKVKLIYISDEYVKRLELGWYTVFQ